MHGHSHLAVPRYTHVQRSFRYRKAILVRDFWKELGSTKPDFSLRRTHQARKQVQVAKEVYVFEGGRVSVDKVEIKTSVWKKDLRPA